jgi:hypothetical protein
MSAFLSVSSAGLFLGFRGQQFRSERGELVLQFGNPAWQDGQALLIATPLLPLSVSHGASADRVPTHTRIL